MVEQHVNGGGEPLVGQLEDRVQHPNHFDEDDMGNPGALGNKRLGSRGLARIVAREKANDDVGVNGAHVAWPQLAADPPSVRLKISEERPPGKARRGSPRRNAHLHDGPPHVHHLLPTPAQNQAPSRACVVPRRGRRSDLELSVSKKPTTCGSHYHGNAAAAKPLVARPTCICVAKARQGYPGGGRKSSGGVGGAKRKAGLR
jgi:hypothetical protein